MSEISDYTLWSYGALRRMRRAILEGDETVAEQGLGDANNLARAVGKLVVANVVGQDTTAYQQAVNDLLDVYEPRYAAYEPWHGGGMAAGLEDFARVEHMGLTGEYGFFRLGQRDRFLREYQEASRHWFYSPLATDIMYAHVMNELLLHHLGVGFDVIPVAPDRENLRAVLPANSPLLARRPWDGMPYIFQDDGAGGRTWNAIEAGVEARLAAQAK